MRISYLMAGFGNTGGSIVLYNFMDLLCERGYEVYAITPKGNQRWEKGIWKNLLQEDEKKSALSRLKHMIANIFKKNKRIIWILRWVRIVKMNQELINNWVDSDVTIATFSWTAYAASYLSDKTVPIYHMQHFEEIFFHDKIERLFARTTYTLPLYKVANSKWLQNLLMNNFHQKSYLLNPGIDLKIFKPNKNYSEKYIEKKTWNVVSFFDERREWKGFNDAVKAMKIARENLEKNGYTINWKVFGLRAPVREYSTSFNYCGKLFNNDLAELYASSDLVLLTSWYESFPLPPIEAMACGTVVISTKYGVEDYLSDRVNGFVVEPRKIDEIAYDIEYAITHPDLLQTIVENALNTANKFDWKSRADELEKIIKLAMEHHSFRKNKLFDDLVNGTFKEYMYQEFKIESNNSK